MASRNQFDFLQVSGVSTQPTGTGALAVLDIPENPRSTLAIQLAGTFTLTITWQGTVDGVNWTSVRGTPQSTGTAAATATAPDLWVFDTSGFKSFRPNITAFTSITTSSLRVIGNLVVS